MPVERDVDGVDDQLDPLEELAERAVGEQRVAFERQVGGVDLEQQAAVDDGAVLGAQRRRHRVHVLRLRRVVAVLHGRRDDAGRRRGHERLGERGVGHERALGVELGRVAVGHLADRRRRRHQADLDALEAGEGQLEEVRVLAQVAASAGAGWCRRSRSCGAARR